MLCHISLTPTYLYSQWFRDEVSKEEGEMPDTSLMALFSLVEPLLDYHYGFLHDIETRLATWEGRSNLHPTGEFRRIGDVLLKNMGVLAVSALHAFSFLYQI
jgi:hypothetical protein